MLDKKKGIMELLVHVSFDSRYGRYFLHQQFPSVPSFPWQMTKQSVVRCRCGRLHSAATWKVGAPMVWERCGRSSCTARATPMAGQSGPCICRQNRGADAVWSLLLLCALQGWWRRMLG